MPAFDINDYVSVQERIIKFWADHPEGRIETQLLSNPADFDRVVIRAEVYKSRDNPTPDASDLAAEQKGTGGLANSTSWHENCSTSAIGRALANLGYATSQKDRPSREEMQKVYPNNPRQEQQYPQQPRVQAGGYDPEASDRQRSLIETLARNLRWGDLDERIQQAYGTDLHSLTRKQASSFIEEMKALDTQPTQNQTSGYANTGQRQQYGGVDRSGGGSPAPATQPQKNRIFMLWKNRPELPTHEGAKHEAFRYYMGGEWDDMTKQEASKFMDMIEGGQIDPANIPPF